LSAENPLENVSAAEFLNISIGRDEYLLLIFVLLYPWNACFSPLALLQTANDQAYLLRNCIE